MNSPDMGFWQDLQYQVWMHSCGVCLGSNQKVVSLQQSCRYCLSSQVCLEIQYCGAQVHLLERSEKKRVILPQQPVQQYILALWKLASRGGRFQKSSGLISLQPKSVPSSTMGFYHLVLAGNPQGFSNHWTPLHFFISIFTNLLDNKC